MNLASYIDHTVLKADCNKQAIETLCNEALAHEFKAVCVPPYFVRTAQKCLGDSKIKVATVIGFPMGYSAIPAKVEEIKRAIIDGVDELDVVVNICAVKNGDWAHVRNEVDSITRAAHLVGMPVVISFTVETDGKLPTGQGLKDAIAQVDAATGNGPIYYMINCAHPSHFDHIFATNEPWLTRIHGLRANASSKSHAELDEAVDLDDGNPQELGQQYLNLSDALPNLNILGGCCGTDHRHIEAICKACVQPLSAVHAS